MLLTLTDVSNDGFQYYFDSFAKHDGPAWYGRLAPWRNIAEFAAPVLSLFPDAGCILECSPDEVGLQHLRDEEHWSELIDGGKTSGSDFIATDGSSSTLVPWDREAMIDACKVAWSNGLTIVDKLFDSESPIGEKSIFHSRDFRAFVARQSIAVITSGYDWIDVRVKKQIYLERCLIGAQRAVLAINQGLIR